MGLGGSAIGEPTLGEFDWTGDGWAGDAGRTANQDQTPSLAPTV